MGALTARGRGVAIGAPALLIIGWALGYREIVAIGVMGVLLLSTASLWVLIRPRLAVTRQIDPVRVTVGETALGLVSLSNLARRPSAPFIAEDRFSGQALDVPIPRLAPGAAKRTTYRLPTNRRRVAQVGPMIIGRSDPFGLVRIEQRHGTTETFWVHPRRYPIEPLGSSRLRSLDGPKDDTMPTGSITFDRIREYVPGDDMRHIHWRSTARMGTLMVRQHVDTTLPDVTVVIDTTSQLYDAESFETAVEVAASVLEASTSHRFPARLQVTGRAGHKRSGQVNSGQDFLDELAGLEPNRDSSFAATLIALARERGGSGLVVITAYAGDDELTVLNAMRRRFGTIVLVIVGRQGEFQTVSASGIRVIQASTGRQFAERWPVAMQ
ncbi:MAG: DUF58 domain-containing protein [Actinomycetota bacterium]|nr:DUF58 domain-containing protein [Actinomycetota bacterium]MDQ6949362.1 DUF58 domain-containing protein [Actinomycetota bacterium]